MYFVSPFCPKAVGGSGEGSGGSKSGAKQRVMSGGERLDLSG